MNIEMEKQIGRLQNQILALKSVNLTLLKVVGLMAGGEAIPPETINLLRRQYLAIDSIKEPRVDTHAH